jgi:chemosensory pili system protein ChpA (sensor histidine kinase/response regulator)
MNPLDAATAAAFTDEFRQSLPAIDRALDRAEQNRLDRADVREAHRLIHALKGAASMVGLAALGYLLNVAEELLEVAIISRGPIGDDTLAAIRDAMPRLHAYMNSMLAGEPVEADALEVLRVLRHDDSTDAVAALRELIEIETREIVSPAPKEEAESAPEEPSPLATLLTLPPAAVPVSAPPQPEPPPAPAAPPAAAADFAVMPSTPMDPELAEIFAQEAQEHLEIIARNTAAFTAGHSEKDSIQELRRAVHTLKGAAGAVGHLGASKLAHRMEDFLDRLYESTAELTDQAVRTLASSSDALHDIIAGTPDVPRLQALVMRLFSEFDRLMGNHADAPANAAAAETTVAEPAVAETAAAGTTVAAPGETSPPPVEATEISAAPAPAPFVERRRRIGDRRHAGPVLRVPVDRLNELVRVVSELVINRSTFEQHHLALIEQIDELKLSTARLRRVTHKLESDYEVRALAGATRARSGGAWFVSDSSYEEFDDLEFDRYTEFHLLTRELTEISSDIATIGSRVAGTIGDFDGDLTRLGRLTREVQDKTMEFRMIPLSTLATQLERTVRSAADSCGKRVDLAIEGGQVALDKSLLEQMSDPLLHLLRNAVDHGIEPAERRAAAGKPERGRITVRASHQGTDVLIEVEDDGAGLDVEKIRRAAVTRGFVSDADAAALTPDAVFAFIFEPGFSTAERVTEISGRGVGMDVVKAKVVRASGRVFITSRPGAGTTISIRVPMTLAIARVLLVRAGGQTFGLPLAAVVQIARPHPTAISMVGSERLFTLDGQSYPMRDLAESLGLPRAADAPAVQPVLVANLSHRRVALAVDEIVNSRDVVVKTLGTHLRRVPGVWGATLLGDGTVVLILSPVDLAGAAEAPVVVRSQPARATADGHEPYTVLVVDDSLSMRHVLSLAVKKAGWTAVPARDGVEALDILQRSTRQPDLVLLDIEMPRMDGFELLSAVRAQKGRATLPIVMLTSRSGDKHRDKARSLGVTDYMVKPFQEEVLIRNIDRLVRAAREAEFRAAS